MADRLIRRMFTALSSTSAKIIPKTRENRCPRDLVLGVLACDADPEV